MTITASTILRRSAAIALLGLACLSSPEARRDPPSDPAQGPPRADALAGLKGVPRMQAAFDAALASTGDISFDALRRRHAPAFLPAHGLDVRAAAHYRGFIDAFKLTEAEQARLDALGFVVVPPRGPAGAGPVDIYYRVFAADLPVFVSADSVLHAWHRSYDAILEATEQRVLLPALTELLDRLDAVLVPTDPAALDAKCYLGVARMLLMNPDDDPSPSGAPAYELLKQELGAHGWGRVISAIAAQRPAAVELMGAEVVHDFSQFIPRGHYARSEALRHYFRAMMWLGRMGLRLFDQSLGAAPNPREEAAARALAAAIAHSQRQDLFQKIDRFYRLHVGRGNTLSPADLLELCGKAGAPDCAGEPRSMEVQYAVQAGAAYITDPAARGLDPASAKTISMRMFPQRFAYDAWITAQTTAPVMPPLAGDGIRTMASPFDVAFALGADRALAPLAGEMRLPHREALPGRLAAARQTLQSVPPTELDATIYNSWLEALMAVARTEVDPRLPRVMQTEAWHDHRLETLLASWAELRHDTILVVEQSVGMIGCTYPKGYVEPLPDLYRRLDDAAAGLLTLYEGDSHQLSRTVTAWGAHFRQTLQRLARLSEQELRGEPMSEEDLAFLSKTVDRHASGYGGTRSYDGWYAALYWNRRWTLTPQRGRSDINGGLPHAAGGKSEPIVSDVHTDFEHAKALEVGTGHPELLVVVIDQGGDTAVYGGPTSSFYAFERPMTARMTDNEWIAAVYRHSLPSRPAFAQRYRAE